MTDNQTDARGAQAAPAPIPVGRWRYDAAAKSLMGDDGTVVGLEDKVALLLDLLIARAGQVVSRDEIIGAVWDGRAVSEQTVPVAISKLRKALDDRAETRPLLETVPKRGYRLNLVAADMAAAPAPSGQRRLWLAALAMVLVVLVAGLLGRDGPLETAPALAIKPGIILTVKDIRAPSGTDADTQRAIALSELGAYYLARLPELLVIRHWWNFDAPDPTGGIYTRYGADTPVYLLKGSLIDDAGTPVVVLTLSVPMTEEVLWSGRMNADAGSRDYFGLLAAMTARIGVVDTGMADAAAAPLTRDEDYWSARYDAELSNPRAAARAAERWRALLATDPGNSMAHNGLAALAARWPELADGTATDVAPIDGDHIALIDAAGVKLFRDGDAPGAAVLLDQALKIAPGDHYALSLMAEAKVRTGDMTGALNAYRLAIRLAPYARAYGERLAAIEAQETH